jgi:NADH-quinone oxidoreductase subunit H
MFAVSALGITLFLGGWRAPVVFLDWVPSYGWFFVKLFGFVALFIWLRGTLPRLRADQLMNLAWKFLLPLVLLNVVSAALWHYTAAWTIVGSGLARWLVCGGVIAVPYVWLGRALFARKQLGPRTYRLAT